MTRRTRAELAIICSLLIACADRAAAPRDMGVGRDSAGIRLVEHEGADQQLNMTEVLRVGQIEGDPDYQFHRIRSITVDSSGGWWVVDSNEAIRHYDSTGRFVNGVGASGQGPGEANGYARAWVAEGKVLAYGYPSILQLFDANGSFLGSAVPRTEGGGLVRPLGGVDGRWVFQVDEFGSGAEPIFRRAVHLIVGSDLAAVGDTIGTFKGDLSRRIGDGHVGRASYFFGNPSFAVDGRGRVYVSDTLAYRIDVFDESGLTRSVRRAIPTRAYEGAWAEEIRRGIEDELTAGGMGSPAEVQRLVESAEPQTPPGHLPFIGSLLVSADGTLWIERADRHPRPAMRAVAHAFGYVRNAWPPEWAAPQVFDRFDSAGVYTGTVELPSEFAVMAVSSDRLYGVLYDELGVEYVTVYEVQE